MVDIHNYKGRMKRDFSNLRQSDEISEENKEDAEDFKRWLKVDRNLSAARIDRYIQSMKKVMEYNDFRLKGASKERIEEMLEQIHDSAYYHKDYSPETKKEYWKFLRTYYKWENGGEEVPEKAQFVKLTVKEKEKKRTHPRDLPKPKDIKSIAQTLKNLRDVALLITHWDLGSRIEETMSLKIKDYWEEEGTYYIRVHGNKNSPDRTVRVDIAYPAINRWLDEGHPDPNDPEAYLFCRINRRKKEKDGKLESEKELARDYASYKDFFNKIKRAVEEKELPCKHGTHIIRKGRISFLKLLGVPESAIDRRVGHIPGSDTTRDYTRISYEDANNAYAAAYGNGGGKEVKDIVPLRCECGELNSGHRDRCYKCNKILDITEMEDRQDKKDEIKELLFDVLEEKGMLNKLMEEVGSLE